MRGEGIETVIDINMGAWGFADGTSPIRLSNADILDSDGDKRLSWNVKTARCEYENCIHGGYRCGTTKNLWGDWQTQDWERVFYHTD